MHFLVIYTLERHPLEDYARDFKHVAQHKAIAERRKVAGAFVKKVKLSIPVLVDEMDNHVNKAYRAAPDRLFVIDASGRIVYKGGRGPFGFRPSIAAAPFVLHKLTDGKQAAPGK